MRNKYAALALGMALTMTAVPVMAASTTNTSTTEVSDEASDTSSNTESSSDASTPPEKPDGENLMGRHLENLRRMGMLLMDRVVLAELPVMHRAAAILADRLRG